MKRLLCVLMVMVMAVLMVPAIAGGSAIDEPTISITASPAEGGTADGSVHFLEPFEGSRKIGWTLKAQANSGYKFVKWELKVNDTSGKSFTVPWGKPEWDGGVTVTDFQSIQSVTVTAIFEKEAPAEPEPIVVVEEKKPEEPHVHAEEWVPGTPATCTSTGLTDGIKCKWCGEVLQAQKEIPKIDHVYSMWVPNGSGKHFASCLYCGNKIDAACEKVQLPIKSTSGAAVILCPVCGDCNGATATAVKGLKVGEGAPYRGTLRVWNIDAGDNNKYLAVSFDRFGKVMQPEGEVSITLPDDMKGTTAGVIGADGNVKTVQESNGTLKLDFTGSQVVVLKGN